MKKFVIIFIILIMLFIIPQTFAGDVNDTDDDYQYVSKPVNQSVDYFPGEDCNVEVNAQYESEDYWTKLDLAGDSMYVYINGNTSGIRIESIPAEAKSFNVNIADINYTFNAGESYSLLFHPAKGLLEWEGLNLTKDCKFYPLTVNVISLTQYDYASYSTLTNVYYEKDTSHNLTVKTHLNDTIEPQNMYVSINDDENVLIENIKTNNTIFNFDLSTISSKLKYGKNTLKFCPNNLTGLNYYLYPVDVFMFSGQGIYVSVDGNDSNSGNISSPLKSIAKAIEVCKNTGITEINILNGTYYEDSIAVDISVNIHGLGDVVIDASQNGRIFKITGENIVELENMKLINGVAPTDAVSWDIHDIVYYAAGGAIFIESVYVTMKNMTFINNTANEFGGAINVEAPYVNLSNCIFIANEAGVYGGAIDIEDDNGIIDKCIFIDNIASNGGAVGWIGANATLTNTYFEGNIATDTGGAVFIENTQDSSGNLIENCSFYFNEAPQQGGAIEVENEDMQMAEYTVIRYCDFINNSAYNGGAISAYYGDVASVSNIFINNTAGYGGAIAGIGLRSYYSYVGSLYLRNNTIINCSAEENGHGIFNMGLIESWLNITLNEGKNIDIPDGKGVDLNVSVFDDVGNPISGTGFNFTVGGKNTINPASDLINGYGKVRFVPRQNGTFILSGIYVTQYYTDNVYQVNTVNVTVNNAIADYLGVIYVSQSSGDDDNTGSSTSPVKTFNQGYILATRNGGSFNIVILEGRYYASKYILHQSFNVTGVGNVILDSRNNGTIFSLYGSENDVFYLSNLKFFNGIANPSLYSGMNDGGAIFFKGGTLYLENDTFQSCSANDYGGAVYINKGLDMNSGRLYTAYAYINNCTFSNNVAKYFGGAIGLYDSQVVVTNSVFTSNSAKKGGAISILQGLANLTVINSTFTSNRASESGGALDIVALNTYNTRYFADVIDSTFIKNTAPEGGAVIGSDTRIINSKFINNSANNIGGAVILSDTQSSIEHSIFEGNTAYEANTYYGNSTLINDNYWGEKITRQSQFTDNDIVNINNTKETPKRWYNNKDFTELMSIRDQTIITISDASFKTTAVKTIHATLKSNNQPISNKNVKFNINGAVYQAITDSNGVASVNINLKTAGTYSISATFEGDIDYLDASATASIKIIKAKTKLTISKKAKKITVTLKSGTKALKSKKISLKINSKVYIAKTNKKGKAVFNLKSLKKKTYTAKITFKGDKTYNKISKTSKVRIK